METGKDMSFLQMERTKRRADHGRGVGAASILMIVMVLAFTTFGILSLVSALADARMSRRAVERVSAYYEAEGRLQQQLADFDAALMAGTAPEPVDGQWVLTEDIMEGQRLELTLQKREGAQAGAGYEVLMQKVVNTGEWNPDTGFEIWDGGM